MQSCKLKKLRKWIATECYKCLLFTHSPIPHQQYKSGLKSFKHISLGIDFIFLETLLLEPSSSLLGSDCCSPHLLQSSWPEDSLHHHPSGSGHRDSLLPGSHFSLPRLLHSSPEEIKLKSCLSEMLYSRVTLDQFGHDGT